MDNMEKLEANCSKLKNDIALLEKRISLCDIEKKATSKNDKSELKLNSLEIKQLRMEVEELQLRLKRQKLSELNLLQDALKEKWIGCDVRGKSVKEIFQMVESRVLDLNNKSSSLSQNLKFLECTFNEKSKYLKDMNENCREDDIMTEADVLQYIHRLENEYAKAIKNVKESEDAGNKMKYILENLRKKNQSFYKLSMNLREELLNLKEKTHTLKRLMNLKEEKQILKGLMNLMEDTQSLKENDKQEDEGTNTKILSEKEMLLKSLEEKISTIRDVTGIYDIKDIVSGFLEQKQVNEYLSEMSRKLEKRLLDLKVEKREITSRIISVKEADSLHPCSEEDLSVAKSRLREQEIRRDSAESELGRHSSILTTIKSTLVNMLSALKPKAKKSEAGEANVGHLAKQLEKTVLRDFKKPENNFNRRTRK